MNDQAGFTILNVDDDEIGRYSVTRTLEKAGFNVVQAVNGRDGLTKALTQPDLILLDINLPDISGLELCKIIRENPLTAAIPVIHLSAFSVTEACKIRGLESGADAYLTEPVSPPLLIATIESLINLRRREERLQFLGALVENSADAIIGTSLQGDIKSWNGGANKIYGYSAQEAIGQPISLLAGQPDGFDAIINKVKAQETISDMETTHVNKAGGAITVACTASLVKDPFGKPFALSFSFRDVTDKKRSADELRRAYDEMETRVAERTAELVRAQRMESLGTLAGGIAHDLNNILLPIMMSLQLLRRRSDAQTQEIIKILEENTERGAALVKQVLSFTRGVSGERIPVQLDFLVSELERLIVQTFPKTIHFSACFAEQSPTVIGDATQIYQVLMNICINARDAMPAGGKLAISIGGVFIAESCACRHTEAKPGSYVLIAVRDSGEGMSSEVLDKIFEPFYTTKEQGKGTGLGLSTSLAIIKSHGGFIDVSSEIGNGTEFKVYLPAAGSSIAARELHDDDNLNIGNGELILVVDDEPVIREITKLTLESCGFNIIVASDGAEAVAMYVENMDKVKVVVTDLVMPHMDGTSMITALHRINPAVNIIATSGLVKGDATTENWQPLVKAFLNKPYTTEDLLKVLSSII